MKMSEKAREKAKEKGQKSGKGTQVLSRTINRIKSWWNND